MAETPRKKPDSAPVIEVKARSVYGLMKAYPVSPAAKVLAEIAGTKTLTQVTLRLAMKMGCIVQFVGEPVSLESVE